MLRVGHRSIFVDLVLGIAVGHDDGGVHELDLLQARVPGPVHHPLPRTAFLGRQVAAFDGSAVEIVDVLIREVAGAHLVHDLGGGEAKRKGTYSYSLIYGKGKACTAIVSITFQILFRLVPPVVLASLALKKLRHALHGIMPEDVLPVIHEGISSCSRRASSARRL